MAEKKDLKFYRKFLPKRVTVEIHKTKDGTFWAKIKELPHCYTQGSTFFELIEMLNDAIYEYFDVPTKLMKKLGYYIPIEVLKKLREEIGRKHWQNIVKEIVKKEQLKKQREVFKLSSPV